jgi:Mg-chelatase subunit ChlD
MEISFLHPVYLLALLAVPLLWFLPQRLRDRRQGIIRSLLMALLVIALARPVLLSPDAATYQVFILDRSESISVEQRVLAEDVLETLLGQVSARDNVSLIIIGEEGPAEANRDTKRGIYVSGNSTSSLSAALEAALQEIPDGGRGAITLISDGLATDRRWGSAVQTLIERGIPVSTFELGRGEGDIYPSAIGLDGNLRVGQTAKISVDVIGAGVDLRVRLTGPGGELALSGPFDSEGRVSVTLEFEPQAAGHLKLTTEVFPPEQSAQDRDPENNSLSRLVAIQDPLKVLYLGGRQRGAATKLGDLIGPGFKVSDAMGQTLDGDFPLGQYDLVMLDDRPAETLPEEFQEHLVEAVRTRGLGLLKSGGEASFGAGGYYETAVAGALPVEISQRTEKRDPSVALAIIIDTSGSMAGKSLEIAKQVARLAVRHLKPHDWVGIVEYHGSKHWAVPMQPADNKIGIERVIGRMQAGGGNELLPVLEEAYYGLKNMRTRYKHIVVITDAGNEDADFEGMIRHIAKEGVNLSTVMVGDGAFARQFGLADIMFSMAAWGKGRYYQIVDRRALVDLILKQPKTTKLPAYQTGNFPLTSRGGNGWWGTVDRAGLPPLKGYVEVASRPGAEVLIEEDGQGYPVLATWRYGLGRVTALMTEPLGAGTESWRDWKDYGAMLGRILSRTASDYHPFDYEIRRNDMKVRITARRNSRNPDLRPEARIIEKEEKAEGPGEAVSFRQRAPGLFEADLILDPDEDIRVSASVEEGDSASRSLLVSMAREDVFPETQVDPLKGLDLGKLALATGGQRIEAGDPRIVRPVAGANQLSLALSKLWPYLLLLALLTYLAELVYRRWPKA